MQMQKGKVNMGKALDVGLVVTESSGTKSDKQDTSSISGNDTTHAVDAYIRPGNDQEPLAEVDSNTTLDSTNMSNNVEKADHDAEQYHVKSPLPASLIDQPTTDQNSSKELYGSNDMAHNYYLEEARKKTQDGNRNLKPREMPSARTHHTLNACTPKPRSNNQISRNWLASKSSDVMLKVVQKADHSKNPSSFSDSKHFVYATCQKCVFNVNHDDCVIKFLKEHFNPPLNVVSLVHIAAAPRPADLTSSPLSITIDQAAPSARTSSTIHETQSPVISEGVEEQLQPAQLVDDPFLDLLTSKLSSYESSSTVQPTNPPLEHISKWMKIHPLEN
ncbi:hypothetical protein Tco_1194881 [Tanacetum coccineum]